jgi:hypothetical protein
MDEGDLSRLLWPGEKWPERQRRLEVLRAGEYAALAAHDETTAADDHNGNNTTGDDLEAWVRKTDALHLAECRDPDCDTVVCREARGLPPLTPKELVAQARAAGIPAEVSWFREAARRVANWRAGR